jgi:hypothetical protein
MQNQAVRVQKSLVRTFQVLGYMYSLLRLSKSANKALPSADGTPGASRASPTQGIPLIIRPL